MSSRRPTRRISGVQKEGGGEIDREKLGEETGIDRAKLFGGIVALLVVAFAVGFVLGWSGREFLIQDGCVDRGGQWLGVQAGCAMKDPALACNLAGGVYDEASGRCGIPSGE